MIGPRPPLLLMKALGRDGKKAEIVEDLGQAIRKGLSMTGEKDLLCITGPCTWWERPGPILITRGNHERSQDHSPSSSSSSVVSFPPSDAKVEDVKMATSRSQGEGPVEIEADELLYDHEERLYEAHGRVEMIRGDMTLKADHARLNMATQR